MGQMKMGVVLIWRRIYQGTHTFTGKARLPTCPVSFRHIKRSAKVIAPPNNEGMECSQARDCRIKSSRDLTQGVQQTDWQRRVVSGLNTAW